MTENSTATPPGICPTCAASPTRSPFDEKGQTFYCPHSETLAIKRAGSWRIFQGVDQATYREQVRESEATVQERRR